MQLAPRHTGEKQCSGSSNLSLKAVSTNTCNVNRPKSLQDTALELPAATDFSWSGIRNIWHLHKASSLPAHLQLFWARMSLILLYPKRFTKSHSNNREFLIRNSKTHHIVFLSDPSFQSTEHFHCNSQKRDCFFTTSEVYIISGDFLSFSKV